VQTPHGPDIPGAELEAADETARLERFVEVIDDEMSRLR